MTLIKITLILIIIVFLYPLFSSDDSDNGKRWCMKIITEYEADNSSITFDKIYGSTKIKILNPDGHSLKTPTFSLFDSGKFHCNVPAPSFMFAASYVYTSDKREWETWD